jgi:transcriptional regulator with XRE-family HTH domain
MTQGQLAEKAGLSTGGIAQLEQNLREPSWKTVQALAAALGVDCLAFTEEAAPKTPVPRGRPKRAVTDKTPAEKRRRGKGKG